MPRERVIRAGETACDGFRLSIRPEDAGWSYCGLRILDLPPGGRRELDLGEDEAVVLPLSGGCRVTCDDERFDLPGRESVFAAVSDFAYLPRDSHVVVESAAGGCFALASAPARRRLPARHVTAREVQIEVRGAGSASRQINSFCSADEPYADRLMAVEVLTPGGNWSSYPPHKHDESSDVECELEEIYYFEVDGGGSGYQQVYASRPDRPIDVLAEVRTGDVVLVPYGYHGPSMAAPGYDLYYLNVMAGPGDRAWRTCDDPAHAWVRAAWASEPIDPRVPMTSAVELA